MSENQRLLEAIQAGLYLRQARACLLRAGEKRIVSYALTNVIKATDKAVRRKGAR